METLRRINSALSGLFRNYFPEDLTDTLNRLVERLIESIRESSSGFVKIFLSLVLIPLIGFLAFVLLIKNFFQYLWRFLKFIYRLIKQWVKLTLQEISFYIEKLAETSHHFREAWSRVYELGQATVQFLAEKIQNDDAVFEYDNSVDFSIMVINPLEKTGLWIFWLVVSSIMVLFLTLTAIFLTPLLHRWLRLRFIPIPINGSILNNERILNQEDSYE